MDYKEGQKVKIKDNGFIGYIVKIYYDQKRQCDLYVICNAVLNAPEFKETNLQDALKYIEDLPKNITTKLNCFTVNLETPDDLEIVN